MSFNTDPLKQAQEIIFSREHTKTSHPVLSFNHNPVRESSSQNHLVMILDSNLNKTISTKVKKTIGLLHKLQKSLP